MLSRLCDLKWFPKPYKPLGDLKQFYLGPQHKTQISVSARRANPALALAPLTLGAAFNSECLWSTISTIPIHDPMVPVLSCFAIQALMGVFDNIYHHEITERLPWRVTAHQEQIIHSIRGGMYSFVFLSLAGITPLGSFAHALAGILVLEAGLTLKDFVTEDQTRKLPWTERVTHTLLTINYGAILALWLPILLGNWAQQPTGFQFVYYGLPTFLYGFTVAGVGYWMFRDLIAARRLSRFAANEKEFPLKLGLKQKNMKVLITGGSGFIGSHLVQCLLREGHDVTVITRDKVRSAEKLAVTPGKISFVDSFDHIPHPEGQVYDTIINLAGEPLVGKRWTEKQKQRILASRIGTTEQLVQFIEKMKQKPKTLINGSAIGYYGAVISDSEVTEDSAPAETTTFSQQLCDQWEKTAIKAKDFGTRVVQLRIGIVLGRDGGVMSQMLFPFEFFFGGNMGSGKHWMPWVHVDDLISMIAYSINNESIQGPVNGTAPEPVTNAEFTKTLGSVLNRPTVMALPEFVLKVLFGRNVAKELLLTGQKITPKKLRDSGFKFSYPTLRPALQELVNGELPSQAKE